MSDVISITALAKGYFDLACLHRKAAQQLYKPGDYRSTQHRTYAARLDETGMGWLEMGPVDHAQAADTEVRHA